MKPINAKALTLTLCALLLPAAMAVRAAPGETEILRAEIEQMQQQLRRMQQRLARLEQEKAGERAERERLAGELAALQRTAEAEDGASTSAQAGTDGIRLGGALRLNYAWRDFDDENKDRLGDFELELFRINAAGEIGGVLLDAEWRRYNDFQAIHHAWVGYRFNPGLHLELGITQVPFGILPYASHSFWFGGTYYLGYEDDYDTGLKLVHRPSEDWTFHYAFFKNPEYALDGRADRYSFDLVTGGEQQNSETNQINLRAERHLRLGADRRLDLGLSLQGGQIYNRATRRDGERWAAAAHLDGHFGPWNLQLQALRYDYDPANPPGLSRDFVQKGAFGFPFLMAARADVYTANLAHAWQLRWGPITGITCYNDFTFIDPRVARSAESVQNVTGCSVSAGGVFAYFDWIAGRNMWFAGGDGIGRDGASAGQWQSRLNLNLGYYF